jgi:hypothetical protein
MPEKLVHEVGLSGCCQRINHAAQDVKRGVPVGQFARRLGGRAAYPSARRGGAGQDALR